MKLYVMDNGVAPDMPKEALISTGRPVDPNDVVAIPIETFLIDHPSGLILYDTGWNKPEHWPRTWSIREEATVINRLAKLGVRPADIRYVVCSHLHLDHAGGLEHFKDSEILVSDGELTNVAKLYFLNRLEHPYIRADVEEWIHLNLKWKLIGQEGSVVPFLDGVSLLSFGSGHAFGLLGLLIELPKTGNIILTSDAVYCRENMGPPVRLPGIIQDPEGYKRTLDLIEQISSRYNADIWCGHDLAQFNTLIKSDQGYYE